MPIYEQTYRRYEAREALRQTRFWPITREGLALLVSRKMFLGLMVVAWLPLLGFALFVYAATKFPGFQQLQESGLLGGRLFEFYLDTFQLFWATLVTTFAGAGLVANDLRTGAILVYLSRPLTRRDYVIGKLCVLLAVNLAVTLVPGLLLYGVALGLAPSVFATWKLAWIGPAIVAQSIIVSAIMSLVGLAISSLSKSARVAGIAFFGLLMALDAVQAIVRGVYDRPEAAVLSVLASLRTLGARLFHETGPVPEPHWALLAVTLTLIGLGSLAVLRARVRAVEIVR